MSERLNLMWASLEELNAFVSTLLTESGSSRLAIEVCENAKLPIVTSDDGNESTVSAEQPNKYSLTNEIGNRNLQNNYLHLEPRNSKHPNTLRRLSKYGPRCC